MTHSDIQLILDYNYWADHRVLAAAKQLTPEQFLGKASSAGPTAPDSWSLRDILVHIADGECGWRDLCQNIPGAHFDNYVPHMFPTVKALAQTWEQDERAMRAYLARLTDADMTSIVRYTGDFGVLRERPLWHCLYHLVNHGTQHRSEAAVILTNFGASPGEMDFTLFLNER